MRYAKRSGNDDDEATSSCSQSHVDVVDDEDCSVLVSLWLLLLLLLLLVVVVAVLRRSEEAGWLLSAAKHCCTRRFGCRSDEAISNTNSKYSAHKETCFILFISTSIQIDGSGESRAGEVIMPTNAGQPVRTEQIIIHGRRLP